MRNQIPLPTNILITAVSALVYSSVLMPAAFCQSHSRTQAQPASRQSINQTGNSSSIDSTLPPTTKSAQPNPQSVKTFHTRLQGFGIPFQINNSDSFIEVQLYQSVDQGKSWVYMGKQPTTGREFPFQATGEGEYWFALKTLDRNGRLLPEGDAQPELKIIVDTTKPTMEMTVTADRAGRIVCRWRMSDSFLNLNSFVLQYRSSGTTTTANSDQSAWQQVIVNKPTVLPNGIYTDQLAFWPDTTDRSIDVRLTVADQAGNAVSTSRQIAVAAPAWRHSTRATARPTDTPPSDPSPAQQSLNHHVPVAQAGDNARWKQAFQSKINQAAAAAEGTAPRRSIVQQPVATAPHPRTNHSNRGLPSRSAFLVGSVPEYVDPPVPAGWTIADPNTPRRPPHQSNLPSQSNLTPNNSPAVDNGDTLPAAGSSYRLPPPEIFQSPTNPADDRSNTNNSSDVASEVWTSQVHRSPNHLQTATGSTLAPNHSLLPVATSQIRHGKSDLVAANPNQVRIEDDRQISESSTHWPQNQYRGLDSSQLPGTADARLGPGADHDNPAADPTATGPLQSLAGSPQSPTDNSTKDPSALHSAAPTQQAGFRRTPAATSTPVQADRRSPGLRRLNQQPGNIGRAVSDGPTKANTQIIGTKRFQLNYDINSIDPSGVGKVDLWMTRDQGRHWKLWGQDPDQASPFPVEVEQDGLYGFRVVVHSKDGLVGTGPSSGDGADIWIRIDSKLPLAQITSAPYGRGDEAGKLIINYRVADEFLILRPVRLSYSRSPDGPWTTIDQNLRNEGRYVWRVGREVPDRIFLRIDATDRAGNIGTHRLPQGVDVSGLVPRGTIHSVVPIGQ